MSALAGLDPDGPRSLSVSNLVEHLTGPLAAGARLQPIALDGGARAQVQWEREPFLLLCLQVDLALDALDVEVTLRPGPGSPGGSLTATLRFAAYSERGATLPIWPFGPDAPALDAARVIVRAHRPSPAGDVDLTPRQVADSVSLVLLEGVTARLAYLMGAEKATLRRAAREVTSVRSLAGARAGSLDRHGADLGIARFTDFDQFLSSDIEVVDICAPTFLHRDFTERALKSGRPVLVLPGDPRAPER